MERVDRLSIGRAPAYGSDAISATVNIVLNRELTGLKAAALSGVSEQGDNFRRKIAAAGGTDFAGGRGNFTFAASYDQVDGVAASARLAYRANVGNAPNPCTFFQPGLCSPFGTLGLLGPVGACWTLTR